MGKIYKSVTELVGRTPLLEVQNIEEQLQLGAKVLVKLEYFNTGRERQRPRGIKYVGRSGKTGENQTGSNDYRADKWKYGNRSRRRLQWQKDTKLSLSCRNNEYRKRKLLLGYGAEIVLTEGAKGMKGAIERAEELQQERENAIVLGQFVNPANPKAHELTTGPEIWEDTEGNIDLFVAGVGTGGTITGTGSYLKEKNPNVKVIAVEPAKSAVLSGNKPGPHGLQGIGAGFVPEILKTELFDAIVPVTEEEAYGAAKLLANKEGILVGISSGAALHAAIETAKKEEIKGKRS